MFSGRESGTLPLFKKSRYEGKDIETGGRIRILRRRGG